LENIVKINDFGAVGANFGAKIEKIAVKVDAFASLAHKPFSISEIAKTKDVLRFHSFRY